MSKSNTQSPQIVHLSAPVGLKLAKASSRSLQVEWQAPSIIRNINANDSSVSSSSQQLLTYSVNWRQKSSSSISSGKSNTDNRQRELNTTSKFLTIDDLTAETVYSVHVSVIVAGVRGPPAILEVKTELEPAFPGMPVDFKAEFIDLSMLSSQSASTSISALKLKWKKPIQNAETIIKYRLFYQHLHYG